MPLSEKEKTELETLDNPEIKSFSSSFNPMASFLADNISNISRRKERVVNLRIKMRMDELGLDPNKDWQRYYAFQKEEEERFDKRFKNYFKN